MQVQVPFVVMDGTVDIVSGVLSHFHRVVAHSEHTSAVGKETVSVETGAVKKHRAVGVSAVGGLVLQARNCIPRVVARVPGDFLKERCGQVAHRPSDDHIVVDGHKCGHEAHGVTNAREERRDNPHFDGSGLHVLAKGELKHKEGNAHEEEHHKGGHEEGTCR